MKKIIAVLLLAVTMVAGAFAKETFKVLSVTGKVTYEATAGVWEDVTEGMELTEGVNINTGLNSTLVVANGSNTKITIKPMKKGLIQELAAANTKGSVKIGSKVTASDVDTSASKAKKSVQTASSRASEAKEDYDWE